MRNNRILILLSMILFNQLIFSQISCGDAVLQLQNYAVQVNQVYSNEYAIIIPNQRCPSYDALGRPFNPQIVQNCRWQMLNYLNTWYGQQCNYVNDKYLQIMLGCATQSNLITRKPGPTPINGDAENSEIDTDQIEEMTAGIDEDKAVKITIPKTASGFKPKQ
jgi:hypothetical protein